MRISDWSSDVCSSDLAKQGLCRGEEELFVLTRIERQGRQMARAEAECERQHPDRSEERRVGKDVSVRVDLGGRRIIKKKKQKRLTRVTKSQQTITIQKRIITYSKSYYNQHKPI